MVLATKALAADVTGKRSFVGVSSLMYHQVVGLGELALARAADELLAMSAHLHVILDLETFVVRRRRRR